MKYSGFTAITIEFQLYVFLYDQGVILVNKSMQGTEDNNQNIILLKLKLHSLLQ